MIPLLAVLPAAAAALNLNMPRRQIMTAPWWISPAVASENDDVQALARGRKRLVLVGTAHVSQESVRVVKETIERERPDAIAIELDKKRVATRGRPRSLGGLVAGALLTALYGAFNVLGFTSGGEFSAAIEAGRQLQVPILLVDQDVDETLRRAAVAYRNADFDQVSRALDLDIDAGELSLSIEKLKTRSNVRAIVAALERYAPDLYQALVADRDETMAKNLLDYMDGAGARRVVLVCGMAHEDGIARRLSRNGYKPAPDLPSGLVAAADGARVPSTFTVLQPNEKDKFLVPSNPRVR